jgi:hypothetical protein
MAILAEAATTSLRRAQRCPALLHFKFLDRQNRNLRRKALPRGDRELRARQRFLSA